MATQTAPPLNRASTAPSHPNPGGAPSASNTQLKQLENTVEQLKSHFVQLLQHLPLTTSQQQQFTQQQQFMSNLASNPNMPSTTNPTTTTTNTTAMYPQFATTTQTANSANNSYSTPNIGLSNVSASNLLNTGGANIIIKKTNTNATSPMSQNKYNNLLSPQQQRNVNINNNQQTPVSMTPNAYQSPQRTQTNTNTNYTAFPIPNPGLSSIPLAIPTNTTTNTLVTNYGYNTNATTNNMPTTTTNTTTANIYPFNASTHSYIATGASSTPQSMQVGGLYANTNQTQNPQNQMNFNNINMHHQ